MPKFRTSILVAGVIIAVLTVILSTTYTTPPSEPAANYSTNSLSSTTQSMNRDFTKTTSTFDTIRTTNGTKHLIPLEEIIAGGPGKDGIPSIDDPKFVDAETATKWLPKDARGIGVEIENTARFYPYAILVWHEIVNDTIGDQPITVTYCPLCKTGIVFDATVDGKRLEFGVSGKLWKSNLLMYNRTGNPETESLWSQVLGQAVVGPAAGTKLNTIPSSITTLHNWQQNHPDTDVLARPDNSRRNYGHDPYAGYYSSDRVSFGAQLKDARLDPKRLVHGVVVNGQAKAYPADNITGTTTDTVNNTTITITKSADGTVQFLADGSQINHVTGFWFSWAAVHSNTKLYQP